MSDDRRMIYEGQAVSAAIDIKVIGNKFVSIAVESLLQEPKNCNIPKSTSGVVKAVEDDRIRVHFRPLSSDMVALWFQKTIVATQLHLHDQVYEG